VALVLYSCVEGNHSQVYQDNWEIHTGVKFDWMTKVGGGYQKRRRRMMIKKWDSLKLAMKFLGVASIRRCWIESTERV